MVSRGTDDGRSERGVGLLPKELIVRARSTDEASFSSAFPSGQLLLIDVGGPESEVASGLREVMALTAEPLTVGSERLAFGTTIRSAEDYGAGPVARGPAATLDAPRLQTMLAKGWYFAAPLVKRVVAGKPFSHRVSVGRARNNDIVLRHKSVSKFHAWFELDEDETLYVGDARSTNRTRVDGIALGRELESPQVGSELQFGDVVCVLCPSQLLWGVLVRP